ncbi:hypothetical protein [Bacillus taeanensis]|nr:hypothetical protein [Bacillus taeanensis]
MKREVRNYMENFLSTKTTLHHQKIVTMTDREIDYYFWLYGDEKDTAV